MNTEVAIKVSHLTKKYKLYNRASDRLRESLHPFRKKYHSDFSAIKDLSFEIFRGETVGIIGLNGSGKSTLLQLICGTLTPSEGDIQIKGRIAALLELGAGFNPEFTGRENVYLYATLIGISKSEIDKKYPEIEAFADIGKYIEQPVKSYSSGMYVRLAFAVAINVDPDILIVDEALAVGDMLFQAKCMLGIKQMMNRGITVLFVSHDISAVKSLCTRCIYLKKGEMISIGKSTDVISQYTSDLHMGVNANLEVFKTDTPNVSSESSVQETAEVLQSQRVYVSTREEKKFIEGHTRYGDFGARILDVKLIDSRGVPTDHLELHEKFMIQFSVKFNRAMERYAIGYGIQDLKGLSLQGVMSTSYPKFEIPPAKENDVYLFSIHGTNVLTQGVYTVTLSVEIPIFVNEQHIFEDVVEHALVFKSHLPTDRTAWFPTKVWVPIEFSCEKV